MRKSLVTAAMALGLASSVQAHPDNVPRTVLAIVAHPDDEIFIGPALAGEARSGSRVIIIYATDGDAGPGVSGMEPGEELALARRKEAYCSAEALGAVPVYLKLGDGTLTHTPRFAESPAAKLRARLTEQIGGRRPEVIMTWGPEGGYGHGDHRIVSSVVTQIVQAMPADERPKLYYPALVNSPLPEILAGQGWTPTAPDLATVRYTYGPGDLAKAAEATQCHKTQFDDEMRAGMMQGFHALVWKGEVAFREAF